MCRIAKRTIGQKYIAYIGWELLMKARAEQSLPEPDIANSDYRCMLLLLPH